MEGESSKTYFFGNDSNSWMPLLATLFSQRGIDPSVLYAMNNNGIKTWEMNNGTRITNVLDSPDKEVEEDYYDEDKFIKENVELHQAYHNKLAEYKETRKVLKKGRKGYLKITFKEESDE